MATSTFALMSFNAGADRISPYFVVLIFGLWFCTVRLRRPYRLFNARIYLEKCEAF